MVQRVLTTLDTQSEVSCGGTYPSRKFANSTSMHVTISHVHLLIRNTYTIIYMFIHKFSSLSQNQEIKFNKLLPRAV